jgi:transcriptional regulator with XRE-family HTH domain
MSVLAHASGVDDVRLGRILRALRRRKGWRQADVAAAAKVSQSTISLIERGHLQTLSIRVVRGVFAAVEARFEASVTWRGGALDRLLDERHARLVEAMAAALVAGSWEVHIEVTFSEFGERGSIDILALRREEAVALIVEIKSELVAIDDTVRRLDVKSRLAGKVVEERFGWRPATVSRLLVIEDRATARRRVAVHRAALEAAFPDRGARVRTWLSRPSGPLSGLWFRSSGRTRGERPSSTNPRGTRQADKP